MRIAVLGMGRMGHAVGSRLLNGGHDVTVWNRSAGKAVELIERGARRAESPAEAAAEADVVLSSLADDAAVLAVVSDGVAGALGVRATFADMSTTSPETAVKVSEVLDGRSLASPILGAPSAVEAGQAVYLVSGPRDHFDGLTPLYETLSGQVHYQGGDVRSALQLKLLANYLLMSGIAVAGETVATAQAVGVSEEVLRTFLETSPLVAPAIRNRLNGLLSGNHDGWFTTALGAKDVRLTEEMAMRAGLRLPIAEIVRRCYEEAAASGYADADVTAVIELVRRGERAV